ncbi:MAG: hypothetical protein ACKN9W_19965 [Methylococcus sp.]
MKTEAQIVKEAFSPEIQQMIFNASQTYSGQMDDFYQAVGMLVIGRLYGWRVMRIAGTHANWKTANQIFGDLKTLMDERGELAHRSLGLRLADEAGRYWEIVRGVVKIPQQEKKALQ